MRDTPTGPDDPILSDRDAETPELPTQKTRLKTSPHGYLVITGTGDRLTPEMVKDASEDELV
jgi:hypothetical protein